MVINNWKKIRLKKVKKFIVDDIFDYFLFFVLFFFNVEEFIFKVFLCFFIVNFLMWICFLYGFG